jgi:hypothetical protein
MAVRPGIHRRSVRVGGVVLAAVVASLALATTPNPAGPAPVAATTARGGPFGTPTIDGVQGAGEWSAAAAVPFRITMSADAGGASADATLFLMNDAKYLYAALRVGAVYDGLTVRLLFDRDRDGSSEVGDDGLEVALGRAVTQPAPLPLRDQFYGHCGTGYCWLDDTQAGSGNPPAGTMDGRAAGAFDLVSGYVELAHPIAGRDPAHDLHLALGAAVGFRLETSISVGRGYGGGIVPVQDCSTRPCRSFVSDLVIATARARVSTPQEVVDAIRVEGLAMSPAAALPGTTFRASFRVVNRSTRTLVVPLDPSGRYLGGWLEEWLERLGPDPAIGARGARGSTQVGVQPIDVLAALGGTSWPPGASITLPRDPPPTGGEVWTRGHPPGDYRYTVRRFPQPPQAPLAQSSTAQFTLKGVADEWQASVGSGGRNGAATLRAWTTRDGSVGLTLRGLRASTGYPVTIRRGTCSGALVTSVGWVTATTRGTVARTIALGRSKVTAIRSAAAGGRLVIRIGTGSLARCGTLSAVPLYRASLEWRVERLPGIGNDPPVSPHGAVPASIAATSTGLVVGGFHYQNDCTWEPVNRTWGCRPPTRQATTVWTSGDGISWSEQVLGGDAGAGLVVAGPARTVVVASGASWWSADGRTWVPASRPPAIRTAGWWGGGLGSVIATGAGFVAVGLDVAAGGAAATTRAWTSSDGDTWTPPPLDTDLAPLCIADLVAGSASLVAVGSDCNRHAAIVVSRDGGLTWERAATGSALTGATTLDVVTHGSSGFVAYGRTGNAGIGVWTSVDGLAWRAASAVAHVPNMDFSWVSDAVPFGPGTVLIGGSAAAADDLQAGVLASGDGVTLRWAPWPPAVGDAAMAGAVAWNGRLYVVGTGGTWFADPVLPQVWVAELGPLP